MPSTFRWAILGTGAISFKFAHAVHQAGAQVAAVVSRGGSGATALAKQTSGQLLQGYDEVIGAMHGAVDAAYIATPPALHAQHAIACLEAGIPVLVEKPFATTVRDATAIGDAARANGLFAMEAMWTRFLPALARLRALLDAGAIGQARMVSGSFGQSYDPHGASTHFDAERGGGALAHLGCYPLSLGQWLFGSASEVQAMGRYGSTGIDEDMAIHVRYANGVIGTYQTSIRSTTANSFAVHGTHGALLLQGPIYRPWGVTVRRSSPFASQQGHPTSRELNKERHSWHRLGHLRTKLFDSLRATRAPYSGNGYHYQIEEVQRLIGSGKKESPIMPLHQSIELCALLEKIRTDAKS